MIKELLEKKTNLNVFVKVKEYKSTFISVTRDRNNLKISLHKLFLSAPEDILKEVINFCLKRDKTAFKVIKNFANNYFSKIDYSKRINIDKFVTKGNFFDLKQILENLSLAYFENNLNLHITWFEKPKYKKFSHFTFGSFDKSLKLIRINKLLDNSNFPFYFINYVVYHEILHSIYEVKVDKTGRRKVHTKEFKIHEKKFPYYKEAMDFEKYFLKKGKVYGRA